MAARRLLKEYKQLVEDAPEGIHAGPTQEDDFLHWECLLDGPEGSLFEGGCFKAVLDFPQDYPMKPPTMRFLSEIFHPNIGKDGKVCISILHSGDDPSNYEQVKSFLQLLGMFSSLSQAQRALVCCPKRRKDSSFSHVHARRAQPRQPRECRRGKNVA